MIIEIFVKRRQVQVHRAHDLCARMHFMERIKIRMVSEFVSQSSHHFRNELFRIKTTIQHIFYESDYLLKRIRITKKKEKKKKQPKNIQRRKHNTNSDNVCLLCVVFDDKKKNAETNYLQNAVPYKTKKKHI